MLTQANLVTGATGLIGSHVAQNLVQRGQVVRALVRSGSDSRFLNELGVQLVVGDLDDPASLREALAGVGTVYHCAARVGDWGPWSVYKKAILQATTNLLAACRDSGMPRVLHVSSINVYGHPHLRPDQWLSEDDPLGQNLWWWDHYCRAKVLTEAEMRKYPGEWTIVRPSWTYGPRDRNTMPRVLQAIQQRRARIVGTGENRLNIVHACDIAEGIVRAATSPRGIGQAYNLSSEGVVSQIELLDFLTNLLGMPPIRRRIPFGLAFTAGFFSELFGRTIGKKKPPTLTRYAVALIGRTTRFRITKAREQLGWSPTIHPFDGLRETYAWYLEQSLFSPAPTGQQPCPTSPIV